MPKAAGIALLALLVLMASGAPSAPMYSALAKVRRESKTVVIGHVVYKGGQIFVDADTVLRGHAKPGRMLVRESPDGHVFVGQKERVVAFIDGNDAFRWVGRLLAGPSIEKGVLKLEGFFDFNAHIVSPGILSLAQLERYLKTGQLKQKFDATLAFPDGKGGLRPSAQAFSIDYEPFAKKVAIHGLHVACLEGKPGLFSIDWGDVDIALGRSCPGTRRDLWLRGGFTGLDTKSGAVQMQVTPSTPLMSESEFNRFARDRDIIKVRRSVAVKLSHRRRWTWVLGEDLVDPRGKHHNAGGMGSSSKSRTNARGKLVTVSSTYYDFAGGERIVLSPSPDTMSSSNDEIVPLVQSGKLTRCRFEQKGRADVLCKLEILPSSFVRSTP